MSSQPTQDASDSDPLIGTVVASKYRIVRLLGRGGMARVYEATNIALDKSVALKFINRTGLTQDGVRRFLREARVASSIRSDHVVQVFDVGQTDNAVPYIVMELLEGQTLGQHLRDHGALAPRLAVQIAKQMLQGLQAAHTLGVIHRDLKPENVFLVHDAAPLAKLLDFGISKRLNSPTQPVDASTSPLTAATSSASQVPPTNTLDVNLTADKDVLGTPYYMSPEQARGSDSLDGRSDLWAVGVILFEMLTAHRPFPGKSYREIVTNLCTSPTPPLTTEHITGPLRAVVNRALSKHPDARYPDATSMLAALNQVYSSIGQPPVSHASSQSMSARPVVPPSPTPLQIARTLAGWGISSAFLGAVSFVAWASLTTSSADAHPTTSPSNTAASKVVAALLDIETVPAHAKVTVNGISTGQDPWRGKVGQLCKVHVQAQGYRPETRQLTLRPGLQTLVVHLAEVPAEIKRPPRHKPSRHNRPLPTKSTSSKQDTSIAGGLELKTDLK